MIAGIVLGTTNSLIGMMDTGFPVLIADETGSRLTPSAVYLADGESPLIGAAALEKRAPDPDRVVSSVKRLMGLKADEIPGDTPFPILGGPGEAARLRIGSRAWLPEEISAMVLGKLKADVERATGTPVDRAVITVPAYFNEAQRAATKRAGELAGFTVERLLAEPTAAALAYGLDRLGERSRVAVFDLGGGTFDISVLELNNGVFHVLSTNGDTRLGGDDFDYALSAAWELPVDICGQIKCALTESDEYAIGERIFTRVALESVCRSTLERTRRLCLRSLADAGFAPGDLNEVILVGGATRMPLVREFVEEVFGRKPNVSQHPDEAVAIGAAIQAGILEGGVKNITLLDITPLSLGIETFGGLMNVIIPRNTTIPCKRGEMFTNAVANQASMRISVLQGEREMATDNWKLGEFEIPFTPAPKGQIRVGVQFEIDADGLLHVLVRDVATGKDIMAKVHSAVEVSDEAVEKMLADSLEHAFEDMDQRIFTEARLKAEEMLPAVDSALEQLADRVADADRERIQGLCADVSTALENRSTNRLKTALAKLDEATQPLATMLVEDALGPA